MSDKPVLWITRKLSPATEARAARDYDVRLNPEDRVYSGDEIVAMSSEVDAILPCHSEIFSADVASRLSDRVKIIANHSVGVDHCDLAALKARGIVVTNTPDVLSQATAEIATLLMLAAARRAGEGDRLVRSGQWTSWSPSFMVGTQLTGKRLGIVGMGRVGLAFAHMVKGFDMELHYYNRRRLPPEKEMNGVYHETVEQLLGHCDVVSLHCPASPATLNLMNSARLSLLPDGAILVNTARGSLVNEAALIDALKSGKLAAAGLDVFQREPGGNPELSKLDNVFMLPHIGSATRETRDAMGFRALDNLDAFFSGHEPSDRLV
ncbi:Glycerate dehydrogenase [Candidatus Filomicrobium marinum]|uniref:Glycerate dehydrogenase n=1 Tax=Candidatus Filomicrobium marinum TaxID=1608628 RepID=A0A0D6JHZ4_9HYPH|nr:D-glycerate dehydrogenase [Candidatus Filomicrobium marinum]CFX46421.1 Glycerate dehydrogenase [Candidatus Filomicrobium marinum]CPR20659.1 Glycerate dehydrogenase [Candidatus Filomicrobium marinum]